MTTETEEQIEETILGLTKILEIDYPFTWRGESFAAGERLEADSETARALMVLRTPVSFPDGSKLNPLVGRVIGGGFSIEKCQDGWHKLSFWHKSYAESDEWVKVVFLEAAHGVANVGDKRRLRRSDALERQHRYQDSSPNSSTYNQARILILEPRPRPSMSPEEAAARSAEVLANKDRGNNWVLGIKRL